MTDPNPPAPPAPPAPPPAGPPAPDKGFPDNTPVADMTPEQQVAYWKDRAQKHERLWQTAERTAADPARAAAELRELRQKATKFDELTEAQKSELQKAIDRAEAAERKATEVDVRATRAEVAAAKGVPAELLAGTTKEELEAAADKLLAFRGEKPSADFGGGARGSDVGGGAKQWTQADLAGKTPDEINAARKAGHLDRLMGKTT